MKILFLCVANSARSQMAEALAKKYFSESAWIESAGSAPTRVSPYAIDALKEIGLRLEGVSKSIEDLSPEFLKDLGFVITLCADEVCPSGVPALRAAERLHWPLPDPTAVPDREKPLAFRDIRDVLESKLRAFRRCIQ